MKRFYKFLSLFLLSLAGITTAVAQDYEEGDLLTDMSDIVGKEVFLYGPGTSADHPAGYMNGADKLVSSVSNACVYVFEETGETVDGEKLYLLKQVSTGLYAMDPDMSDDPDAEKYEMTADRNKAFKMTVLPFEDLSGEDVPLTTRTSANDAKQDLSTPGFVLCRDKKFEKEPEPGMWYCYIGGVDVPFISCYIDTNVWCIYSAKKVTDGRQLLETYLQTYFPNGVEETNYPAGSDPGYYDTKVVEQAKAAYDAANVASMDPNISEAKARELCEALKAAYDALSAPGAFHPLTDGYYFIKCDGGRALSVNTVNGVDFVWSLQDYELPDPIDVSAAKQIWHVTPVEGKENQFYVQNFYNEKYFNSQTNSAVRLDGKNCFITGDQGTVGVKLTGGTSAASWVFYVVNDKGNLGDQIHSKAGGTGLVTWNDVNNPGNCFHFTTISADVIESLKDAAGQAAMNDRLQAVYDKATSAYESGTAVKGAPKDAVFKDNGGLAINYFSTDDAGAKEPGASPAMLGDGDVDTYFHTDWSEAFDPSMDRYHYIAVELSQALSGGISVKVAKRGLTYNDFPTRFAFFGANDVNVESPNDAEWTYLGASDLKWNISIPGKEDLEATRQGMGVATGGVLFDGSYKYFKMAAIATLFNDTDPRTNRGYFAIGELQVYPGVLDEENSTLSLVSEATRTEMEKQLAAAKAELEAGKATEATIAALQAAYDKFVEELPMPSLITDAVSAANIALNNAKNNGFVDEDGLKGMGYYSPASVAALEAAVKTAEEFDANDKSAAEINAVVKALNDAIETFNTSFTLPVAGEYFLFRGYSSKVYNNQLTSLNALVRTTNTALEGTGCLQMTRPDGANQVEAYVNENLVNISEVLEAGILSDSVEYDKMLQYVWYVEKAENAKIVLRNVGNGLYFAPRGGVMGQSVEAFEIPVMLTKPGRFVLDAGEGTQVNAASNNNVVTWADKNDENAQWIFEVIENFDSNIAYWPVKPGVYQVLTLPFGVGDVTAMGTAYSVVGTTEDNKLVLAEITDDNIPAGTPFIFKAETAEMLDNCMYAEMDYENGMTVEGINDLKYDYTVKTANGLVGTLLESVTPGKGYGVFNDAGNVVSTGATTAVGVNSGYIHVTNAGQASESDGDAVIELGDVEVTSIDENTVVVLPSVVNVYNINGTLVRKNVKAANATNGLPAGIYVVGNQKVLVK